MSYFNSQNLVEKFLLLRVRVNFILVIVFLCLRSTSEENVDFFVHTEYKSSKYCHYYTENLAIADCLVQEHPRHQYVPDWERIGA